MIVNVYGGGPVTVKLRPSTQKDPSSAGTPGSNVQTYGVVRTAPGVRDVANTAVTTPVGAESALAAPYGFDASTRTRSLEPASSRVAV